MRGPATAPPVWRDLEAPLALLVVLRRPGALWRAVRRPWRRSWVTFHPCPVSLEETLVLRR